MNDLEEVIYILSFKIYRDRYKRLLGLSQVYMHSLDAKEV